MYDIGIYLPNYLLLKQKEQKERQTRTDTNARPQYSSTNNQKEELKTIT